MNTFTLYIGEELVCYVKVIYF